jgi:hypothetical protein
VNVATDQGRVGRILGFVVQASLLRGVCGWVFVLNGRVCGQSNGPDDGIPCSLDGAEVARYGKNRVGGADGSKFRVCLVVQYPIELE